VSDDGCGFDLARVTAGNGLANMRDRVDALGGRLSWSTGPDGGTRVLGWVPAARVSAALVG
jgi:signal transduction histidine kinase